MSTRVKAREKLASLTDDGTMRPPTAWEDCADARIVSSGNRRRSSTVEGTLSGTHRHSFSSLVHLFRSSSSTEEEMTENSDSKHE